jgi:hypothetical protein
MRFIDCYREAERADTSYRCQLLSAQSKLGCLATGW